MPGTGGLDFRATDGATDETEDDGESSPVDGARSDDVGAAGTAGHESPAAASGLRSRLRAPEGRLRTALIVGVLSLSIAVPFFVALGVLHQPHWLPLSDVAQIELRVRDVGFDHPPLVGLGGRLRGYGEVGSHPGPLSFFALAPLYRVFGADGFALQVSAAALGLAATGLSIWMAYRRGGWRFALALTATLVFLFRGYEAWRLIEAWNPHLPIVWWFVFLLAVWSVLCGDRAMLPIAIFAGSYCAQTHVPYAGLVAGFLLLLAGGLAYQAFKAKDRDERRHVLRWSAIGAVMLGLLWLPPVIDQLIHDPGNFAILIENFRNPYDEQMSTGERWDAWFTRLDVSRLVETTGSGLSAPSSYWPGSILLAAWGATAVIAWRRRDAALIRLHLVVATGFALGLVAIMRIFGPLWPYLMLWAWGTTALAVLAIVWTLLSRPAAASESSEPSELSESSEPTGPVGPATVEALRWPRPTVAVLGVLVVALTTAFSVDAAHSEMPEGDHQSLTLLKLLDTAYPILDDDPVGCGDDCRYLVTWTDPYYISAQGYGLYVELERHGLDIGAMSYEEDGVRAHRVRRPADADAEIHLAVGDAIEIAQDRPGAREIAFVDPNTPAEQRANRDLREQMVDNLREEGFDDLADRAAPSDFSTVPAEDGMSQDLLYRIYAANLYEKPTALFLIVPEG